MSRAPVVQRSSRRAVLLLLAGTAGCGLLQPSKAPPPPTQPPPALTPMVMKTVPPRTPTPVGYVAPLPTRPVADPAAAQAKREGKAIGPIITHLGLVRADGNPVEPASVDAAGTPTYVNYVGSGFMLVVEAKPGLSNAEVARSIFRHDPDDPSARPDLQIQVDRDLGDGSEAVCDARRPVIGGIPGINPPSFAETKKISAALNDMACRFETFIESKASCTLDRFGDFSFIAEGSDVQFCMVVARAWNFPMGDTLITARVLDIDKNPGPVAKMRLRRMDRPTPAPRPVAVPTPTAPRRRQ